MTESNGKPTVFWAGLMERSVQDNAVLSLLGVAAHGGMMGHVMMTGPYQRTDTARNKFVDMFLKASHSPLDALVMVDCDHILMPDLVSRLARFDPEQQGVVGALAFRRGEPYDPCFFKRGPDGELYSQITLNGKLSRCAIVGTGAILIRRWVFDRLAEHGYQVPYFRYAYKDGDMTTVPSEDVYFGMCCENAGIDHWCDTSTEIPHLISSFVDTASRLQWIEDHHEEIEMVDLDEGERYPIPDEMPLLTGKPPVPIATRIDV